MPLCSLWRHCNDTATPSVLKGVKIQHLMMTSSNGNIFRVTGPLCGEFTGPVNFPHKGQWRGALVFSLIGARINDWVNNREAGDLRRHRGHYDVRVMLLNTCTRKFPPHAITVRRSDTAITNCTGSHFDNVQCNQLTKISSKWRHFCFNLMHGRSIYFMTIRLHYVWLIFTMNNNNQKQLSWEQYQ